jgi:hypothetical protein
MGVIHNHRTMGSEVRLAIRRLAKEPALALASVFTLALGIGACTAMFSIVEAVLLKPMDVAQPQRLVVTWPQFGDTAGEFSYNAYLELSRQSATFEHVALSGSANWPVPVDILLPDGRRTRATQCAVSDTFFDVLGARPLLGRTFHAGEDRPGAAPAIVVSAAFWRTKLGSDPSVVGHTLAIGRDGWRIIGVMPPEFFYPDGADFWTPAATLMALTSNDKSPAARADPDGRDDAVERRSATLRRGCHDDGRRGGSSPGAVAVQHAVVRRVQRSLDRAHGHRHRGTHHRYGELAAAGNRRAAGIGRDAVHPGLPPVPRAMPG